VQEVQRCVQYPLLVGLRVGGQCCGSSSGIGRTRTMRPLLLSLGTPQRDSGFPVASQTARVTSQSTDLAIEATNHSGLISIWDMGIPYQTDPPARARITLMATTTPMMCARPKIAPLSMTLRHLSSFADVSKVSPAKTAPSTRKPYCYFCTVIS
jgi:hypothetical protein